MYQYQKSFGKIPQPLTIKIYSKFRIEGIYKNWRNVKGMPFRYKERVFVTSI